MPSEQDVLRSLGEHGISHSGSVVRDAETEHAFFVFVEVVRNEENRQVPSNRKLDEVRQSLSEQGVTVNFLLSNPIARDIEAGLRATLLHAFGNDIRNAFLSVEKDAAVVWLDTKRDLLDQTKKSVRRRIEVYLAEFGLRLASLTSTAEESIPSLLACLRLLRQISPVDTSRLSAALESAGFSVPSIDWLTRRLDVMRKAGKVVRLDNGSYAMSLQGLRELGTAKARSSPDISRLLALTRSRR